MTTSNQTFSEWYDLYRVVSEDARLNEVRIGTKLPSADLAKPVGRTLSIRSGASITLRTAYEPDFKMVAKLARQLGYDSDDIDFKVRITSLNRRDDELLIVAEAIDSIHGWIQISDRETIESGKRLEIVGLVVDQDHRRKGIAKLLVEEAIRVAKLRGRDRVVVRTNISRPEAAAFYSTLGFELTKQQKVFTLSTLSS